MVNGRPPCGLATILDSACAYGPKYYPRPVEGTWAGAAAGGERRIRHLDRQRHHGRYHERPPGRLEATRGLRSRAGTDTIDHIGDFTAAGSRHWLRGWLWLREWQRLREWLWLWEWVWLLQRPRVRCACRDFWIWWLWRLVTAMSTVPLSAIKMGTYSLSQRSPIAPSPVQLPPKQVPGYRWLSHIVIEGLILTTPS